MSNQVAQIAVSERVRIPATLKRSEAAKVIAALYGSPSASFALTSQTAARDTFVSQCCALALAQIFFGDASRLERLERYAATLPEYRKSKGGVILGKIGQLIVAFREASAIGNALKQKLSGTEAEIDLSLLAESPVFAGLIEAPKATVKPVAKSTTVAAPTTPTTPTMPVCRKDYWLCSSFGGLAQSCSEEGEFNPHWQIAEAANAERARARAEKMRAEEVERQSRLQAKGQDVQARIVAFCSLANELGIRLTPTQLKALDALDAKAKAA